MEMFRHIKRCISNYELVANGENAKCGKLNEDEIEIIDYFDFDIAKALIKEPYINAEKIAKFILIAKGLSGEIQVK